jgi:hypothetical protein
MMRWRQNAEGRLLSKLKTISLADNASANARNVMTPCARFEERVDGCEGACAQGERKSGRSKIAHNGSTSAWNSHGNKINLRERIQ